MRPNGRVWLRAYAPLILWVGVIFFMSSPEASFDQTSRIIGPLLHFLFPNISSQAEGLVHGYVRKAAHLTEYAILAFLALRACTLSSSRLLRDRRFLLPLVLVAVIASLDEFNQSFEASRTSSIWDVALDLTGGVAMILFCWVSTRPKLPRSPA